MPHNVCKHASIVLAAALIAAGLWAAAPKPFAVVQATIHQLDDGPPSPPSMAFVPGETIYFVAFMDNYQVSKEQRLRVTYRIEALDPKDIPLFEAISGKIETELAAEDKGWKPKVRQEILIPPLADSGVYRVRIAAKDELGNVAAVREAKFQVQGRDVPLSDTLVAQNFGFYRSEDDPKPLAIPSYRPGDTVWCRFDLTGYKLGAGNKVHVSYAITVNSPSGRLLFRQAQPTVEERASFYPKRYTPSMFNLSLTPDISKGEYTITVDAADQLGAQKYQAKQIFRIE